MGCTESVEENVQDNRKTGYQFNTNNQQFNQQNVIWNQFQQNINTIQCDMKDMKTRLENMESNQQEILELLREKKGEQADKE